MEYLDGCNITARTCCEKGGHHRRQTCIIEAEKAVLLWRCIFQTGGLGI